jgi:hypothetical protein
LFIAIATEAGISKNNCATKTDAELDSFNGSYYSNILQSGLSLCYYYVYLQ